LKHYPAVRCNLFALLSAAVSNNFSIRQKGFPLPSGLGIFIAKQPFFIFGISHIANQKQYHKNRKPMKKFNLLTISLFALFVSACHSDDRQFYFYPGNPNLEGQWKLVNVSGSIAGTSDDFPEGMITWKFNGISQTVYIVNNNTDEQKQDILPTGTYHFNFVNNEATPELCAQTISIDGTNLGCYTISTDEFIINQTESDGFMIRLVR
jgi:hypothetical protein